MDAPAKTRHLTMPCEIETRRDTADRRNAWHRDCPRPAACDCPAHRLDAARSAAEQQTTR
jgi:hypothetical protein